MRGTGCQKSCSPSSIIPGHAPDGQTFITYRDALAFPSHPDFKYCFKSEINKYVWRHMLYSIKIVSLDIIMLSVLKFNGTCDIYSEYVCDCDITTIHAPSLSTGVFLIYYVVSSTCIFLLCETTAHYLKVMSHKML